jgi:hypothetical protein
MGTVAHFNDLRSDVVDALRAYFHHTLLLPLVLLTAAVDEGAAWTRRESISFAQAIDTAHQLDRGERSMLLALAGTRKRRFPAGSGTDAREAPEAPWRRGTFACELVAWIDCFDLAGRAVIVDRARALSGAPDAHYGVRPMDVVRNMPVALKALAPARQLAAIALLALHNGEEAQAVFKGKRARDDKLPAVARLCSATRGGRGGSSRTPASADCRLPGR